MPFYFKFGISDWMKHLPFCHFLHFCLSVYSQIAIEK